MYGYASPGVLAPAEAEALRKAVAHLLGEPPAEGQPVRASQSEGEVVRWSEGEAVRWMNQQGFTTARGNPWRREVLHRLLTNPRIAGLDSAGEPIEGWGESVLTPDQFRQLNALFVERSGQRAPARDAHEYLATGGCAVCGRCETAMTGARVHSDAPPSYRCPPPTETVPSCGSVRMNADRLEDPVAEQVLAELLKPGAQARLEALQADIEAEAARLRQHIGEADARFASIGDLHGRGLMVESAFLAAQKANKEDLRLSRARLRYLEQMTDLPIGGVHDLVHWWTTAPHASKKALLLLEVEQVRVLPQPEGSNDPHDRIQIVWRQSAA
ncbi:recombinase family protein [Streptomyces sp. NPDC020719]|uniref:recombinase zinc beta ribbon domain-containing protein n=1 Tax=Streptomyces sp. NPDC020719 TaxID=3154896 RepID=UPI0033BFB97C